MAPKLALFLALSLLVASAVQGCDYNCPGSGPVVPKPPVMPTPKPGANYGKCPRDALKLGLCANVLNLVKVGIPDYKQCCPLLDGLVGLDAALCLCTVVKGDILGIKLNLPIDLSLILNKCNKYCPSDFKCPN